MVLRYTVISQQQDPRGFFVAYEDYVSVKAALRILLDQLDDITAGRMPPDDVRKIAQAAAEVLSALAAKELFMKNENTGQL